MKNKKYKRLAKRIKGTCLARKGNCYGCNMFGCCLAYTEKREQPMKIQIRTLEKEIRTNFIILQYVYMAQLKRKKICKKMKKNTMKFYEFNRVEYYALIGANTLADALELYENVVSDLDEEEKEELIELVDVITEEKAKEKYCKALSEEVTDSYSELEKDFERKKLISGKSRIFLMDGSLL